MRLELVLAPCARKASAFIDVTFWLDGVGANDAQRTKDHGSTSTSGIGKTNRPPQSRTNESCEAISSRRFQGRIKT